MNLTKIILISCLLSMICAKTTNVLDRYDEIISKEFTLIDDEGNVMMKLSQIDFEQISQLIQNFEWFEKRYGDLMKNVNETIDALYKNLRTELYRTYDVKIDSLNKNIIAMENKIQNNLLQQINDELNSLDERYLAYKRGINRTIDDTKNTKLPDIEEKIKELNNRIDAILELDVIQKEIKNNKKAYYLP